ncbi:MAG: hypothetical protein IKB71_00855 [Lentisphaeria bacterium]|nr:hypothetical protein [Lentisphaeria bacterium]
MALCGLLSLIGILILQNSGDCFWKDILIGVFSSSLVSLTISLVAFLQERERILKKFYENLGQCYFSTLVFKGEISILQKEASENKLYPIGEKINKAMNHAKDADERKNELMDYHYSDFSFYNFISKTLNFIYSVHQDLHAVKLQKSTYEFLFNANQPIVMECKNAIAVSAEQNALFSQEQLEFSKQEATKSLENLISLANSQINILEDKMTLLEKIYNPDWAWSQQKEFWRLKADEHIKISERLTESLVI